MSNRLSANQKSKQSEIECKKRSFSQPTNWLLMALFLMFSFSFAQTVTIGSGSSVGNKLPVVPYYGYSYSQQIVLKSEIATSGNITKLRFYSNGSALGSTSNNWTIYMGHTTKTAFTTNTDWILSGAMTQVYSGLVTASPAAGWMEITLTTPFAYNNTDNLVVSVDENAASYTSGSSTNYFRIWTTPLTNRGIYYQNDTTNPDPTNISLTGTRTSYISQMQFDISAPVAIDMASTAIVGVPTVNCPNASAPLSVTIKNQGTDPIDFSTNNAVIAVSITGASTQTLNATVSTGTLAAGASQTVVVTPNANFSAAGTHAISASVTVTGDGNSGNNTTTSSRVIVAPTATPYAESFTTASTPSDWDTTGWSFATSHGVTTNGIYKNMWSSATTGQFNTVFVGPVSATGQLKFDYRILDYTGYPATARAAGWGNFKVQVSSDCGVTFTDLQTVDDVNHVVTTAWATKTISLASYSGQNVQIRIIASWLAGDYYLDFDNFSIAPVPTCASPSSLASSAVAATTATLSWTAASPVPASGYDIYYSTTNTAPTGSTTPTVDNHSASPYNAMGLSPASTYYWWVRGDCNPDTSLWVSGGSFTTLCAPVTTPTVVEGFDTFTGTAPSPACWSEATGALSASSTLTGTTSSWLLKSNGFANISSSNKGASINLYSTKDDWIISNPIDLGPTPGVKRLKYDYAVTSYNGTTAQATLGTHVVRVVVSTDGGATWSNANVIKTYAGAASYSNTGATETILLNYSGVVKIGFLATTTSTSPDIDFHIDNVSVDTAPTDTPDYVNLQFPASANVLAGNSTTVYARVYEGGLTDTTSGQAPGIVAWIGISPEGASASSNPNTWTTWIPATFNVETDGNSNDEYQANIGSTLAVGTYRYASRFQLNGGPYVYGGNPFNAWNGTDSNSGVLTVNPNPTQCATLVAPAPAATNVTKGTVALSWTAPASGPAPTGYKVYFGTTSGALTLATTTNGTTFSYNASAPAYSTTYYWQVVPTSVIGGGDAVGCSERSFTTQANPFLPYCSGVDYGTNNSNVEPITLVNFAGINNSSPATLDIESLENFISITGNVTAGSSYNMTLKGNTDGASFKNYFRVFIDWNQDGDFLDAGESIDAGLIQGSTGLDAIQAVTSIAVPTNALPGTTRMRIKKLFGSSAPATWDACVGGSFDYGQSEDYSLVVSVKWYLDADNDTFGDDANFVIASSNPGGYVLIGGDCNDAAAVINPAATEVCWNGIDDNCDTVQSEGCAPIVVNMATANNSILPSFAIAVSAHPYTYPGTKTYRFSIKNNQTGATEEVMSATRFVTIPSNIRNYNISYDIKASAVVNGEEVPYAGNTITVFSPVVSLVKLAPTSCGVTLASLSSNISSTVGLNATSYTFRARLTSDNGPTPTYYTVQSASRIVSMNSFIGLVPQYGASYTIDVQYEFLDIVSATPEQSGYGAACTVMMPSIPVIGLSTPTCGTTLSSINATISANPALYALQYEFRLRAASDNGPTPAYSYTTPNASRFSSMSSFGITLQYSTSYTVDVRYKISNNGSDVWSGYGAACVLTTPFFPVTEIDPLQCGVASDDLNQTFNIVSYPGFPTYRITLSEQVGETLIPVGTITRTVSNFKLNMFAGAQVNKIYSASVSIYLNGVFGPEGKSCDISTFPPAVARTVKQPFTAVAYPNPFANSFLLDVKTSNNTPVFITVYDMLGRLVEQQQANVTELETTTIGSNYPSGVYNVIITQADETRTVRVVKR